MTLTVGSGPFGQAPGGSFNFVPPPGGVLYLERSWRRVRAVLGDVTVADSRRPWVLHESGTLPKYHFPRDDVRMDLLEPEGRAPGSALRGEEERYAVRAGERVVPGAAWSHPDPPAGAPEGLAGLVALRWDAMDEWWEEDEQVFVHLRDPYHRVDVLDASRHIVVALGGEVLADSTRARVLFETALPARWYLPAEDVRGDLLEPMDLTTGCAYKGFARYWSLRTADGAVSALAWTYDEPRREVAPIRGMRCFFDERVDVTIDDEPQTRPRTPWSAPDWHLRLQGPP